MSVRRKIRWGVLGAALAASSVGAQTQELRWVLLGSADSDTLASVQAPNARLAASRALSELATQGYLYARVDSITPARGIYLARGPGAAVRSVEIVGAEAVPDLGRGWSTAEGGVFDPGVLAADLDAAAQAYLAEGYPDVELVPRVELDASGVSVRVDVAEGARARLAGVELVGGRHPSRALATRLSRLRAGEPYRPIDGDALRRELEATGLFLSVGEPALTLDARRQLVVRVPVRDAPPGTFDLVLGYLPPTGGAGGGVVGSGRLELRNPFGGGRRVTVALDRTPGLVSAFDLALADPFVAGLPVGLAGTFSGYARDSTFSRQRLRGETTLRIASGLDATLSVSREGVAPGAFGAGVTDGRQRVVRSSALFYGAGLRYRSVDAPLNPTRGIELQVAVEQGRRRRAPDSQVEAASSLVQRRLDLRSRAYVPTLTRQALVLGADAHALLASRGASGDPEARYDEGELIRFGGATTLRGYDEDAFLGNVAGRALAEYRLLLGPRTFVFGFGDLGVIDQPPLPGRPARRSTASGYGAGIQAQTGIGVATITYALNPDLPASRGKVHVGLSVGL